MHLSPFLSLFCCLLLTRTILLSVDVPSDHCLITVLASEPLPTHTALTHMAHKLIRLAIAGLEAVQAKVALRTRVLAVVAHQSRGTHAMAIVLPARSLILALAVVLAVLSVSALGTRLCTLRPRPSRWTITLASHIRTLSAVPAIALERTIGSIPTVPTRMLTRRSRVSWCAFQRTRYMVTLLRLIRAPHLTLALTVLAVVALIARLIALLTHPAGRAVALARQLVAGRIVLAVALFVTFGPVETDRTLGLTGDS